MASAPIDYSPNAVSSVNPGIAGLVPATTSANPGITPGPARYDFQSAIGQRQPLIDQLGTTQNTYIQQAAQRRIAAQQAQQQAQMAAAQQQSDAIGQANSARIAGGVNSPGANGPGSTTNYANANQAAGPRGSLQSLMQSIRAQESGGNYGATNRDSGAAGAYQIMPGNIQGTHSGWDYEALGRDISLGEFYASPQIQDQIASYKLKQYEDAYGPAGAAIAWYAGPGAAQQYHNSGSVSNGSQGNYPTVSGYMQQILQRMGL